jgi:integrase
VVRHRRKTQPNWIGPTTGPLSAVPGTGIPIAGKFGQATRDLAETGLRVENRSIRKERHRKLAGFRRGEIASLRWSDVDLEAKTLSVVNNRVQAGNVTVENDPKPARSRRTLPLPERLVTVLRGEESRD